MTLTSHERIVLLHLIDADNSRDRVNHQYGRTSAETFAEQEKLYWSLRRKLVAESPTDLDTAG